MALTEQDAEIARSGEDQVARRALKKLHQWPHSRRSHFAHAGGAILARDRRGVRLFWQMREGRFRRYSSIRGAV